MSNQAYVTNPSTGRPVRVGSKVHKQLLKSGAIESNDVITPPAPIVCPELNKSKPVVIPQKKEIQTSVPLKRPSQKTTIDKITSIAIDSIREQTFEEDMTNEQMDVYIRDMITSKLSRPSKKSTNALSRARPPLIRNVIQHDVASSEEEEDY
jgi:hypothetical protein